ncbi:MAG TPA: c-type cytochrome biogenesis protein CcsB [Micromonosporaceae bacterium]|nr:c-type cytochrome biogenesis protein CcsB [Micromonosporaceae bacterium]
MAELSNQLLPVAVLAYLVAMLGYLAEYAFGGRGMVARAAARPARELVGAGVGGSGSAAPAGDAGVLTAGVLTRDPSTAPEVKKGPLHAGAVAVWFTVFAAIAHLATLVTRGLAAGRVPWGNMYEFVLALSFVGVVTWLVLVFARPALRPLGLFVTLALVLILGFAGMVLYTEAAPLVPALNSYWLKIHVSAAAIASGLLLIGFVPAVLFLIRSAYDRGKRSFPASIGARLPEAEALERLTFRLHAFAFPIWTFAIMAGAIWAEAAWGRYWGWDPKETWSFVSWVAYAAYLHARVTPSVKRTVATWFAVAAWITMVVNLYVINFVAVGLHSYAT